ncbi:MAG: DnaA regulatory inactivator Hda [Burkholderiales bacterium]|nr:DnaA regulatory inactivator Hda [Burkholderiales bacterium]
MATPRQLVLDLLQPAAPTLGNFVAGRNAEALEMLGRLATGSTGERIVYLWGERGCGRSHLLQALAAAAGAGPWRAEDPPDGAGLTLVDDVERLGEAAQIRLFSRLNAVRARSDAACVAAGAVPPAQLPLREDLRTRLAWGLVYQLQPLADAEKAEALRAHAGARGLTLGGEVIDYLLSHLPRDMRTLAAAVDALDAFALAHKRPLTVPLVRQWLAADET